MSGSSQTSSPPSSPASNQASNQASNPALDILESSNLGVKFIEHINNIITALGITDETIIQRIRDEMEKFDQKSKYKIISDITLQTNVNLLLQADRNLSDLVKTEGILHSFYDNKENKVTWEKSMEQVARLQGLIILRKISQNDCDGLIKSLLAAFDTKLKAVNTILESDLKSTTQAGGSDNNYLVKYLKYKNKYLKLLKNNI